MGAMTIRGLDDITITALKEKAKQDGTSINEALVKILRKELGVEKKKHTAVYHVNTTMPSLALTCLIDNCHVTSYNLTGDRDIC